MVALGAVVKVVYVDGLLSNGTIRSIRGKVTSETDLTITLLREDGELTIGKNFIIKIENWQDNRRNYDY